MKPISLAFALVGAFGAASVHGAILVNETFADGNRTGDSPPSSLEWIYGAHRSSEAFTSLSVGSNQMAWDHTASAGVNSFSAVWGHFAPSGSPVSVAQGETLRLSFTVAFSNGSFVTTTGGFRWSLLNSGGSRVAADFAGVNESGIASGTTLSGWRGYEGQVVVHDTGVNTSGLLTRERTGSGNGLFTSSNWAGLSGSSTSNPTTTVGSSIVATLELTRTAGGMQIQAGYNGVFSNLVTDSNSPFTSFDTIAFFALDGMSHDITLSNIQLELIPEPSVLLLGLAGLMPVAFRRHR